MVALQNKKGLVRNAMGHHWKVMVKVVPMGRVGRIVWLRYREKPYVDIGLVIHAAWYHLPDSVKKVFEGAHTKRMLEILVTWKCHVAVCRPEQDIFPGTTLVFGIPMPCSGKLLLPRMTLSPLIAGIMLETKNFQKVWTVILCNNFHSHTSRENYIPLAACVCILQLDWLKLSPLTEHANGTRHKDRMAVE